MDKLAKVYYSTVNTELKFQEIRIALESERSGKTGNICEFDNGLVGSNDMTAFRKACRHFKHGKKLEDIKKYEAVRIDADPGKPEGFAGEVMLQRMNNHHASVTEWGQSFITAEKPRHILDIGCGGGGALERISERYPYAKLYGVDYSKTAVEESLKHNIALLSDGRLQVECASVEKLPYEDSSFDVAYTVESFYFWPDPAENLKEVYRVLKNSGALFVIADLYEHDGMDESARQYLKDRGLYSPTAEVFEKIFKDAGFSEVIIHTKEDTDWICAEGRK